MIDNLPFSLFVQQRCRYQQYIQLADSVLERLRDGCGANRLRHRITIVQLPEAIARNQLTFSTNEKLH